MKKFVTRQGAEMQPKPVEIAAGGSSMSGHGSAHHMMLQNQWHLFVSAAVGGSVQSVTPQCSGPHLLLAVEAELAMVNQIVCACSCYVNSTQEYPAAMSTPPHAGVLLEGEMQTVYRDSLHQTGQCMAGRAQHECVQDKPPEFISLSTLQAGQPFTSCHCSIDARRKVSGTSKQRYACIPCDDMLWS